jgi:drug/metabolite transporter (DMT)-like permease
MKNKELFGHIISVFTILVWGTTFISTKIILKDFMPVEILFIRFSMAYIALIVIYPKFKKIKSFKDELIFLALGLSGVSLYFITENMALKFTLASNVGLIISTSPIITAILANYFTKDEKMNSKLFLGFIIAILGISLVMFNGRFILKLNPKGDLLTLAAALTWAIYSVLVRIVDKGYNSILATRKIFFYGLLTSIPLLILFKADLKPDNPLNATLILNIIFLGLIASALCYVTWNKAVSILGSVRTSNYIYLIPFVTMVTSVVVLHEKINALTIIGGILILTGVYVSENGLSKLSLSFSKKLHNN